MSRIDGLLGGAVLPNVSTETKRRIVLDGESTEGESLFRPPALSVPPPQPSHLPSTEHESQGQIDVPTLTQVGSQSQLAGEGEVKGVGVQSTDAAVTATPLPVAPDETVPPTAGTAVQLVSLKDAHADPLMTMVSDALQLLDQAPRDVDLNGPLLWVARSTGPGVVLDFGRELLRRVLGIAPDDDDALAAIEEELAEKSVRALASVHGDGSGDGRGGADEGAGGTADAGADAAAPSLLGGERKTTHASVIQSIMSKVLSAATDEDEDFGYEIDDFVARDDEPMDADEATRREHRERERTNDSGGVSAFGGFFAYRGDVEVVRSSADREDGGRYDIDDSSDVSRTVLGLQRAAREHEKFQRSESAGRDGGASKRGSHEVNMRKIITPEVMNLLQQLRSKVESFEGLEGRSTVPAEFDSLFISLNTVARRVHPRGFLDGAVLTSIVDTFKGAFPRSTLQNRIRFVCRKAKAEGGDGGGGGGGGGG
eukprot:CAMPEP_0170740440 /NCGR_PEP_ID=MMETSP0437-20130122/5685_1 /TAXON_ID=0 /ORGANISM="Sexangularia sp." /LENGTH=482 /DNA_ID=CAMNT_0011078941 /DNA_START=61 /DNA_END=1505 /DNA_ORIENTATION=+